MMPARLPRDVRILELMSAQATAGLAPEDERALRRFFDQNPQFDSQELDYSAAAAAIAFASSDARRLPPDVHLRVMKRAIQWAEAARPTAQMADDHILRVRSPRRTGWFAAAVCLVFALAVWRHWATPVQVESSVRARYEQLISSEQNVVRWSWSPCEPGYSRVAGEVVWSQSLQSGFMRLCGMPANDPREMQYQLWIVDVEREGAPVDGGVFDVVASERDLLIPLCAKLKVGRPVAFAVTAERPGGVVVSAGPLLIMAAADASRADESESGD